MLKELITSFVRFAYILELRFYLGILPALLAMQAGRMGLGENTM
jgi:hypothetical protein